MCERAGEEARVSRGGKLRADSYLTARRESGVQNLDNAANKFSGNSAVFREEGLGEGWQVALTTFGTWTFVTIMHLQEISGNWLGSGG